MEPSSRSRRLTDTRPSRPWVRGQDDSGSRGLSGVTPVFRAAFRLSRPAALLAIAAVAVACVGSAGAAAPTQSPTPVDPDNVTFRVSWEGGFVTPACSWAAPWSSCTPTASHHQGPVLDSILAVHAEFPGADPVPSGARAADRARPRAGPPQGRPLRIPGHRRCGRYHPRDQPRRRKLSRERLRADRSGTRREDRPTDRARAGGGRGSRRAARVHRRPARPSPKPTLSTCRMPTSSKRSGCT